MVVLRDIPFASMCEHHLMPFTGRAHVGYIPNGRVVGLSKLARLVDGYARRPANPGADDEQIADAIVEELQPDGCGVIIEAAHTCMTIRGSEEARFGHGHIGDAGGSKSGRRRAPNSCRSFIMAGNKLPALRWAGHALEWGAKTHVMAILNATPIRSAVTV